ncbi:MAG: alkaline phosphatase family protein [Crocinitomicaceae bacterium]|nr:alkaline phosphatase family protein [Crocinitomicaceae bacterium]
MGKKLTNKVLVIGWDAADWKVITPLIQQGKMPTLKKFMEEGTHGNIKTLDPPLSPMLWTSIATGMRADKHGITGFIEPTPDGQALRPVTTTSRKVKAIWNILNQEGYKSNVVGWWPSNPAEPINGVMVSNLFQGANKGMDEWDMPAGTVHPESKIEDMKKWRVHPHEISVSMVAPFIPKVIKDKEFRKEKRVASCVKILAHAASIHSASTNLMRTTEWDFMAVYHDAIDHFSHLAMKFHPPYRNFLKEEDYESYKGIVEAGYRFHDMMLERTLELIDDDTTVVLVSDHGFHSDHLRPIVIPKEPSGPAYEHSPYGIFVARGPGIRKGGVISGASVIDVTPTLLTLLGLPVGNDMEGKVLTACFDEPVEPEFIETWEKVDGKDGMHSSEFREDPWAAQEALQQLVDLGYIEAPGDDKMEQVEKSKRESLYYLARNYIDGKKFDEGIKLLKEIFDESKVIRYGKRLASAYLKTGQYRKCEKLIVELKEAQELRFEEYKKTRLEKDPNDPFANKDMEEPMYLEYIEGLMYLAMNKQEKALPILNKILEKVPHNFDVCSSIAQIHLARKNYDLAARHFIMALAIDEMSPIIHHGLGLSFLRQKKYDDAVDEFFRAIELNFYYPKAHYHLGEAFFHQGNHQESIEAFKVVVRLSPGTTKAHEWLEKIYRDHINDASKAEEHRNFIQKNIVGEIVVVSGLPRSGTSMMMQMLDNGGMPVMTDKLRQADDNNPKGYHEFDKVKRLHLDQSWVKDASGKAIKIVTPLLNYLPPNYRYKVIMMEREMSEIITSQQKMLGKSVRPDTLPMPLFTAFRKQQEKIDAWIESQPQVEILKVHYKDIIDDPISQAERINNFLGKELSIEEMASVVDPALYRNKSE